MTGIAFRASGLAMITPSPPRVLRGLSEIASNYDAGICGVWGVLHNGREPYWPAIDAMRRFREGFGPVVLLSNAPRPAEGVRLMFEKLGMPEDFYDAIVTSGGEARADIERRTAGGRTLSLFYLGPDRDHSLFEGLNVRLAPENEAETILCTGFFDDETENPDDYRALLASWAKRRLPFLCANPDIMVQRGDRLVFCAGAIARLYESMGGETVYYGKPFAPVFHAALEKAKAKGCAARPLVIGDGLETDILGANKMALDSLFIAGGIHRRELGQRPVELAALLDGKGVQATATMTALSW